MCNKMVGTSPLGGSSKSNNLQQRLGGGKSPYHQNQIKSQNFSSKTRHSAPANNQAANRMSPKNNNYNSQNKQRNTPTKFNSNSTPVSSPAPRNNKQVTSSAPLRISPSQEQPRRDRHRSYSSSVSCMSTSPSSARTSPSFSHSNSPSPKLSASFASSTCYQAPIAAALPLPPTQWISMSAPPAVAPSQTCRQMVQMSADPSQHLKSLLKVLA